MPVPWSVERTTPPFWATRDSNGPGLYELDQELGGEHAGARAGDRTEGRVPVGARALSSDPAITIRFGW